MATTPNSSATAVSDHDPRSTYTDTHDHSRSSKYKGVRKRKWGKWVSEIRLPNSRERIWLGSYDSPEKAARAFDAALYCLRGRNAHFNFSDTPLELEIDVDAAAHAHRSLSPPKIQELAARFANQHQQRHQQEDPDPPVVEQSPSEPAGESDRATETEISSGYNMYDGTTVQVDQGVGDMRGIDWSFLNSLDSNSDEVNNVNYDNSHYGLYSGLDKMHSGELYPTYPPPLLMENTGDANEGEDAFSQQSLFLWNF